MRVPLVRKILSLMGTILFAGSPAGLAQAPGAEDTEHISFQEVDTLFTNPGQGWMVRPTQLPRFPASVLYLRFDWYQVEPEDGHFDWTLVDEALAQARAHGQTLAIRVMTANAHSSGAYSSPKWLFDAGCRSFAYRNDTGDFAQGAPGTERIEPDYADSLYLARHGAFLQALGRRYDGNPNLEFLDIGSYGIWGEWHTTHPASAEVRRGIIDMYLRAFPRTHLVYMSDDAEMMSYALAHGTGLRRDGVGSPWHEARWAGTPAYAGVSAMADAWKEAPIVFEWFLTYAFMHERGWSIESAVDFMLRNHVTVINDNLGDVPPEAMPLMEKLARLAGFRFVLREMTQPKTAHAGATLPLTMRWANVGVGKLYYPYTLTVQVRDAGGDVVASTSVATDPGDWLPGEREVGTGLKLPRHLTAGEYTIALSFRDPSGRRPPLHLAFDAPAEDGWYTVSHLKLS